MKMGGVGIKNVNKRIKYYYGNEYGAKQIVPLKQELES